jgi:molybdopterin-guanine dinucleotide biosynthesis protein
MKVINLWGGPGCGKSTTATGLFSLMKMRGHRVELVTEYAKELTYDKNWEMLVKQEYIFPEQYQRQLRLKGQVDYAITDSPLPLNLIYARDELKKDNKFNTWVVDGFNEFDNFNIMLMRVKPYSHYGRKESSDKALDIDHECVHVLEKMNSSYKWVRGDEDSPVIIYNMLFGNYEISLTST